MKRLLPTFILLAGLFALTAIHPQAQTAPPFVTCATGGLIYFDAPTTSPISWHCVDPNILGKVGPQGPAGVQGPIGPTGPQGPPGTALTGGTCPAPAAGFILYAKLPDGSCLNIFVVPAPGSLAMNIEATYSDSATQGVPVTKYQTFNATLTQ
jgi:hypothetical protein